MNEKWKLASFANTIPLRNDAPFPDQAPSNPMLAVDQHNGWFRNIFADSAETTIPYAVKLEHDQQRYTLLRLALVAYGLERGEYPQRLDLLADYFKFGIPHRVSDGQSFAWFPDGFDETVYAHYYGIEDLRLITEELKTPILLPVAAVGMENRIQKSQAIELTQDHGFTFAKVADQTSETTISGTVLELDWTGKSHEQAILPEIK